MQDVRNGNGKLIGKISEDQTYMEIELKGFLTRITVNPDGTLNILNITKPNAA